MEGELDALKEDDNGDSCVYSSSNLDTSLIPISSSDNDDGDETTQLKADIEDARRRGQMAKVKVLDRRPAALR